MKEIAIERRHLAAILQCSPPKMDIRYYLNGVMLELLPHEARLVATDGHMMGLLRMPKQDNAPEVCGQYIIPGDVIKLFKLSSNRLPHLGLKIEDKQNGVLEEPGGYSIRFKFVEGKFPNYRNVVPRETLTGVAGQFNPALLTRFAKAAKLLGHSKGDFVLNHNGTHSAAIVMVPGFTDFVGIVMPMRTDMQDRAPDWALEPAPETPVA